MTRCDLCYQETETTLRHNPMPEGTDKAGITGEVCFDCYAVLGSALQVEEDGFGGGSMEAYEVRFKETHDAVTRRIEAGIRARTKGEV